ncbi:MAG: hypothetical protein LBE81_09730 [Azonexus sp.]|uniref:hypothetical protein n=1 Tax=Azonexus sp. TaxID=1872668 RepID=UPI002829CE51|nr:hypothetical protein [Azonexus sp.]MDR0776899.1 hypothetical protein [Azonexus sp.]
MSAEWVAAEIGDFLIGFRAIPHGHTSLGKGNIGLSVGQGLAGANSVMICPMFFTKPRWRTLM